MNIIICIIDHYRSIDRSFKWENQLSWPWLQCYISKQVISNQIFTTAFIIFTFTSIKIINHHQHSHCQYCHCHCHKWKSKLPRPWLGRHCTTYCSKDFPPARTTAFPHDRSVFERKTNVPNILATLKSPHFILRFLCSLYLMNWGLQFNRLKLKVSISDLLFHEIKIPNRDWTAFVVGFSPDSWKLECTSN